MGAGIAYLARATPIYASNSIVYVRQSTPSIMGDVMSGGQRSNGYLITQCQIITSTAIAQSALAKPGIADLPSFQGSPNAVGKLRSMIEAIPDTKAGELISVGAESPDAREAAAIANAVVDSYIEQFGEKYKSTAVEVVRILQTSYDQNEEALRTTQEQMNALKRQNPDINSATDRVVTPAVAKASSLGELLMSAQLRQLELQTAVEQAKAVQGDPYRLRRVLEQFDIVKSNDAPVDPALLNEYRNLRNQADELTARLGSQHDSVKAVRRQLSRVEGEVADATRGASSSLISQLEQAVSVTDARVADLQRQVDAARATNAGLNGVQAEYDQLAQKAQRLQLSLNTLDTRMKDVKVTEDVGTLSLSVLERAVENGQPVRPVRAKTLAMATMAGLMLGVGLALLRDTLDHRLRTMDEIASILDVPVLGAIPHIATKSAGSAASGERGRYVHLSPKSSVAEAFRTLRTAAYFAIPTDGGTGGKTLLVTSPAPGDGKSTTASNLAIAFAQAGRRVLLIDADCRRPAQARIQGLPNAPGLADVLSDKASLATAIKPTPIERLWLIPAGEIPGNPAELLDSQAFRSLLSTVAADYDQVIVDSPPIVPVTDARIIAAMVDATLLVVRAERSTRRIANHAREALATVGARLIGAVVSDVPRGSQSYGYGYYGAGRYGYAPVQVDVGGSVPSVANGNGVPVARDSASAKSAAGRERVAGEWVNDPRQK